MNRISILFALLLLLAPALTVVAADIEVNATCLLPDAITAANTDTATNGCDAGSAGADTITITAAGTFGGTITLSDQLIVQGSATQDSIITIVGGDFTVSGDDAYRVFLVQEYGDLSINNLIVTNGRGSNGGAIKVDDGGILSLGGVTVKDSASTAGNGGGIRADGELTMTNSAVYGNEAAAGQSGGGLALGGNATIRNSAIYNNSTDTNGGGVDMSFSSASVTISGSSIDGNSAVGSGGGFLVGDATDFILKNSTVYGNSAGEGAALRVVSGTATVTHVTFVDNQVLTDTSAAVLRSGGILQLRNSIIARSTADDGTTPRSDCSGTLGQNINNLVQDGTL